RAMLLMRSRSLADIRTFSPAVTPIARRRAMGETPSDSSEPSGVMTPTTSSGPQFRCRSPGMTGVDWIRSTPDLADKGRARRDSGRARPTSSCLAIGGISPSWIESFRPYGGTPDQAQGLGHTIIPGETPMSRSQTRSASMLALRNLDARLAPLDRYGLPGVSSAIVKGLRALFVVSISAA